MFSHKQKFITLVIDKTFDKGNRPEAAQAARMMKAHVKLCSEICEENMPIKPSKLSMPWSKSLPS